MPVRVSVLFSEPKIPQHYAARWLVSEMSVSVLFSEPKIPQPMMSSMFFTSSVGFSALQRAENSSIQFLEIGFASTAGVSVLFSEPKIPQFADNPHFRLNATGFSALQRAENSSIFVTTYPASKETG